jgi:hypothetical protein
MKQLILAVLLAVPAWAAGEEKVADGQGEIVVTDAKLGTGVLNNEIQGEATSFKPTVTKIYCWTHTKGGAGTEIVHNWYKGNEKISEIKIKLKGRGMRTWSYKAIPPGSEGDWRVDVVGPDGKVLKSLPFKIAQ